MGQLAGKVMRENAEVILVLKVDGRYYPATNDNTELFERYLQTGEAFYLGGLTNELEV